MTDAKRTARHYCHAENVVLLFYITFAYVTKEALDLIYVISKLVPCKNFLIDLSFFVYLGGGGHPS